MRTRRWMGVWLVVLVGFGLSPPAAAAASDSAPEPARFDFGLFTGRFPASGGRGEPRDPVRDMAAAGVDFAVHRRGGFFAIGRSEEPAGGVERQEGHPANSRWRHGGITFATLHVERAGGEDPASAARRATSLGWLGETFDTAERTGSPGLLLVLDGDPRFRRDDPATNGLRAVLRAGALRLDRPVVVVHAGGGELRIDRPMVTADGRHLPQVTRVQLPAGGGRWVRGSVRPEAPDVFHFEPRNPEAPDQEGTSSRCPVAGQAVVPIQPLPSGTGEASGLVASTRYPGWGWMIRDSGHPPSLYAVRFPGADSDRRVREIHVSGARNVDWEDIALRDGRLYVVESDQSRQSRVIYEIPEPDPLGPPRVRVSARYAYAYPQGKRHNTEAAFFFAGQLVLVTKTTPAVLYRFHRGLYTGRVNRPARVTSLPGSQTGSMARVTPDGRSLVLANHRRLFVYETPQRARRLPEFAARPVKLLQFNRGDNVEGGDFFLHGGCKLVLTAESKQVYRTTVPPPWLRISLSWEEERSRR